MFKPYTRAQVDFESIRDIGTEGKNSTTYLCHDPQLNADVVVKKILKSKLEEDLYFEEAQALYKSSHPNVVPVLYACQDDDSVYVAMPYFSNGSVKGLLNGRFLTVREIVALACQTLTGLHNVHSKGLVHFDVKPDNILLSERNEALLSDFGLAKAMAANGTAEQDRFYFKNKPPEALGGGYEFDIRFDIYQFGLALYRMCNGETRFYDQYHSYFDGDERFDRDKFLFDVRNARFPDRSAFLPHIPERLRRTCKKCLEVNANDRFQSAIEIINELAPIETVYLDWVFTENADCQIWRKNVQGTEYEFTVQADGATEMTKSVNGGERRRVRNFCKGRMTMREIRTALGEEP